MKQMIIYLPYRLRVTIRAFSDSSIFSFNMGCMCCRDRDKPEDLDLQRLSLNMHAANHSEADVNHKPTGKATESLKNMHADFGALKTLQLRRMWSNQITSVGFVRFTQESNNTCVTMIGSKLMISS